jgi:hypothetical protein
MLQVSEHYSIIFMGNNTFPECQLESDSIESSLKLEL